MIYCEIYLTCTSSGVYGSCKGLTSPSCSGLCPVGYYCPEGSTNATRYKCPAGRYGMPLFAKVSRLSDFLITIGATKGLTSSACSGICSAGYHCPEGSISPTQLQCGIVFSSIKTSIDNPITSVDSVGVQVYLDTYNTTFSSRYLFDGLGLVRHTQAIVEPNSVFCPEGSGVPIQVFPGFYTVGFNSTTRSSQSPCPIGNYCVDGVLNACPAGRYGRAERLDNSSCTGLCSRGYYCPAASTTRNAFPCPAGTLKRVQELSVSSC